MGVRPASRKRRPRKRVNALEPTYEEISDDELKAQTYKFRARLNEGETLDDLLPEAFATVREASKRALGMRHFDVQIAGGMVLNNGDIAEMKTGEGKTLVATLPVYLNALTGKGAHVVTVNDYLARRDADWMGRVYERLGMSVGVIVPGLDDAQRRAAYGADITYGTNNEFGFDYLRDNMKYRLDEMVQRGFNFAIVDEVDSILIDEARTPLIISGPTEDKSDLYLKVDRLVRKLEEGDCEKDEKNKSITLTEEGTEKIEKILIDAGLLKTENLYDFENTAVVHHGDQHAALDEAAKAAAGGDFPYGAVVVDRSGHIVARAQDRVVRDDDPTCHAEIEAVRAAAKAVGPPLSGHALVSNVEPCAMCSTAAWWAGIDDIAFGLSQQELFSIRPESMDAATLRAHHETINGMRAQYFDLATRDEFFGEEVAMDRYTVARLALLEDDSLSTTQQARRLALLQQQLPDSVRQPMEQLAQMENLRTMTEKLQSENGSAAELREVRESLLGSEAADRLEKLDAERSDWQQRIEAWLAERQRLLSQGSLSDADREALIDRARAERFNEQEIVRARALERIGGQGTAE